MAIPPATCVNHSRRTTRVSCAACGSPICTDCMRETPVGMKCPACVRMPRHARGLGRPRHMVVATGAGLGSAVVLGAFITSARIGFFGLLAPIIAGVVVGAAVGWGAKGLRARLYTGIAAATAVIGLVAGGLLAGATLGGVAGPQQLFGLLLAALAAGFMAGR